MLVKPRVGSDHRPGRILDLKILVESQIMVDLVAGFPVVMVMTGQPAPKLKPVPNS